MGYQPSARVSTVVQGLSRDVRSWHNRKYRSHRHYARIAYKPKGIRKMNNSLLVQKEESAIRIDNSNLNHHIWNNNGTWWIHYTIYPTPVTAERIRHSLKTKNLDEARNLRDKIICKILGQVEKIAA